MRPLRSRPADVGNARATYLSTLFGRELRVVRVTMGLTQAQLGQRSRTSQIQVSRAERGHADISLKARCRLAAACGHELGWRLYPIASVPLRDSGQLALGQAIVAAAHRTWLPRLEVPVAPGDLRAADLVLTGPADIIHVEIERALVDFQAQLRSAQVKRELLAAQTERPIRLAMAFPDTTATRQRIAPFADLIARTLPASSRAIWRAIRDGEPLSADGILFVRATRYPTKRLPRDARTP